MVTPHFKPSSAVTVAVAIAIGAFFKDADFTIFWQIPAVVLNVAFRSFFDGAPDADREDLLEARSRLSQDRFFASILISFLPAPSESSPERLEISKPRLRIWKNCQHMTKRCRKTVQKISA